MKRVIKEIDPSGIPLLLICLILSLLSLKLQPIFAVAVVMILCPIGFGFLFKDKEREKAKDNLHLYGMAWCKGAFLLFFILAPIVAIFTCAITMF
jgi:glucose uptake protein GlcU